MPGLSYAACPCHPGARSFRGWGGPTASISASDPPACRRGRPAIVDRLMARGRDGLGTYSYYSCGEAAGWRSNLHIVSGCAARCVSRPGSHPRTGAASHLCGHGPFRSALTVSGPAYARSPYECGDHSLRIRATKLCGSCTCSSTGTPRPLAGRSTRRGLPAV